ncbi:chemotaxis protein CheW [Euzebya sp.]|uniref:chemotaxis protein CheW n=1 Tax=Euzebya sp. TaxID=1971409 RepID=UPI003512FCF6
MTTTTTNSFHPAEGRPAPPAGARQLCTFSIDSLFLGVDVLDVQEVIRQHEMTRVPLAPAAVSGLINLRGQIVTAIDLRNRLGLPPKVVNGPEDMPLNVVVRTADGAVSLLVDEISDVIEVGEDRLEPTPPTLSAAGAELIDGVYKLDGQLLLVLNTPAAVDVASLTSV